jgi:predicted acyltransferase
MFSLLSVQLFRPMPASRPEAGKSALAAIAKCPYAARRQYDRPVTINPGAAKAGALAFSHAGIVSESVGRNCSIATSIFPRPTSTIPGKMQSLDSALGQLRGMSASIIGRTEITSAAAKPANDAAQPRLVSLDVLRGLTIMGMLIVNDPGNGNAVYWPLDHADWHGWTPTDLIFPSFLFIVGITTHLSLSARRARGDTPATLRKTIVKRAAIIFLIGLFLNWFPGFSVGHIAGDPDLLQRMGRKLLHLRITGILQHIALVYAFAGFVSLYASLRAQVALLIAILLGYWALLMLVPVPDTGAVGLAAIADRGHTLAAWIDRGALDWGAFGNHLYSLAKTWDPEGVLSTLPAIGTAILGLLCGRWITSRSPLSRRVFFLLLAGVAAIALGLLWGEVFPINKKLWTSSFVLFTGGVSAVLLACSLWLIDIRKSIWWTEPFRVFGVNPILAFTASDLMAILIYHDLTVDTGGRTISAQEWFNDVALASWLPPKVASLAFGLLFVFFWYLVLRVFYRRGIVLKV